MDQVIRAARGRGMAVYLQVMAASPPGYRVLDLHDDGGIATEVAWLEGYRQ